MLRYVVLLLPFFAACDEQQHHQKDSAISAGSMVPKPNTVVASDSIRIPDPLNDLYYSIEVVAGKESNKGVYEVLVTYGHNDASTQLTMPEADKPIIPEVRRGNEPYSYIIGFHYGTDTTFNDYYYVRAGKGKTIMKYMKAYSFK